MKVLACRKPLPGYEGDHKDIATLLRVARLSTIEQIQQVVDTFFTDTPLSANTRAVLDDILDQISREQPPQNPLPQPPGNRSGRGPSR